MVVAEALDFPGAVSQGFDLSDAWLMIAWNGFGSDPGSIRMS